MPQASMHSKHGLSRRRRAWSVKERPAQLTPSMDGKNGCVPTQPEGMPPDGRAILNRSTVAGATDEAGVPGALSDSLGVSAANVVVGYADHLTPGGAVDCC